jgi:hypothetical protein
LLGWPPQFSPDLIRAGHDEVDGASSGICVPKRVIVEERITREGRP